MSRTLVPPNRDYAQGEQFTAVDFNRYESYSRDYQAWADREHHPDGWHRAPHIPIAAGILTFSAGAYTLSSDEGIASVSGGSGSGATGLVTITLDYNVRNTSSIWPVAWPRWNDALRFCFDDGDYTKTSSPGTCRIAIVNENGALTDESIMVLIFGVRA